LESKQFLKHWGFRGPNEWELRSPTWGTKPDIVMAALASMRHANDTDSPNSGASRQTLAREEALTFMGTALGDNPEAAGQFESFRHIANMFIRAREKARMTAGMLMHEQRLAALEFGSRAHQRNHASSQNLIFMLTRDELCRYAGGDSSVFSGAEAREAHYLGLFDRIPPFIVVGQAPPVDEWERRSTREVSPELQVGETMSGMGASPGVITGVVRIVTDPSDPGALEPGEILVSPITDPAWTPLFLAAGGVVCEVGAPASHAAIVSRELGIPCAVSVADACSRLSDGMTIEIDGATGIVRRVA
jgi:rifampicin phosphotransferase